MLDDYNKKKDSIVEAYDALIESNLLPIDDISEREIQERQEKLRDDQFVLCVAGQIKAGKSTLLNALIFQEEILPADDLPHTAKITAIDYAQKPHFTAHFYNKQEWDNLKQTPLENDAGESIIGGYFKKYLEDDIELSIQQGIYESEIIASNPKIIDDLSELKNFVAKDGAYTPFIKSVTIGYPSELLKNITIVDTPGTNDPNQFRSKMTEEWIHKADAVIYTTYAGRALDDTDINFIDKYLIHVVASKRLIAVNKIDTVDDKNEVINWVESLKDDEKYSKRIFGKGTTFDYISAMGALISGMLDKGKELNESLEYYKELLEEQNYLSAHNHGVLKLKFSIEEKLIANKGSNIIDSHQKFILTLFQRKIEKLQKELSENKNSLNTLMSDQDDLDKKLSNIKKTKERVSSYFADFKVKLSNQQNRFNISVESEISKLKREISDSIQEEISRIRKTNNFANDVKWIVKNNIEKEMDKFIELGKVRERDFQNTIDENINELIEELEIFKAFNPEQLRGILTFASSFENRNISNSISNQFSSSNVNNIVKESTVWFQRWFDTKGGLHNINSSIMDDVNALLEKEFNINMSNSIKDSVKTGSDKLRSNVEREINQSLSNMQKEVEELQGFTVDKEEKQKEYQVHIETISYQISELENSKRKFEELLDGGN